MTNKPATEFILSGPGGYIPELQASLDAEQPPSTNGIFGISGPEPFPALRITLHLQDVTVRQILNAVVMQTETISTNESPRKWICPVNSDGTPGISRHEFHLHVSVPVNWQEYRSTGKPGN